MPEAGRTALGIHDIKLTVVCPKEGFELQFEGALEPRVVTGSKNGLHPSALSFEGEGGKTGHLLALDICGGECAEADLSFSGELTMVGTMEQLVTAE
jgi:hypothetical protein